MRMSDTRTEAEKDQDEIGQRRALIDGLKFGLLEYRQQLAEMEAGIGRKIREQEERIEALLLKCKPGHNSDSDSPVADAEKRA